MMKAIELDITNLEANELKQFLLKLIEKAKNKAQLIRIIERVEEVYEEDAEDADIFWSRFTPEQRAELEQSFEDSYNPENWIEHEDMIKKHAKWLQK
jgi:hypothetical protein